GTLARGAVFSGWFSARTRSNSFFCARSWLTSLRSLCTSCASARSRWISSSSAARALAAFLSVVCSLGPDLLAQRTVLETQLRNQSPLAHQRGPAGQKNTGGDYACR